MRWYFIKTPAILKRMFSKYCWSFATDKKVIYLTFDDGPIPEVTPFVLSQLKKYNAKATFFCIGDNIKKHPTVFSEIIKEEHSVGNHTFNHLNGWKTSVFDYLENMLLCEKAILNKLAVKQQNLKLFRPPYGKIKPSQAEVLIKRGYKIIMWDVLSADFDEDTTKEQCLKNVLENTKNGSIVVFHDSLKAKEKLAYALPKFLEVFAKKGYQFKAIR